MKQVRFSFDKVTIKKIIKGLWKSVYPTLAVLIATMLLSALEYINTIDFGTGLAGAFVVWGSQNITNIIKEWIAGEKPTFFNKK